MRLRNSLSSASGTFTRNGRIAALSAVCLLPCCLALVWVKVSPSDAAMIRASLGDASTFLNKPTESATTEPASKPRLAGDEHTTVSIVRLDARTDLSDLGE